jgi:hypothetical protein
MLPQDADLTPYLLQAGGDLQKDRVATNKKLLPGLGRKE